MKNMNEAKSDGELVWFIIVVVAIFVLVNILTGCGRARYRLSSSESQTPVLTQPATSAQCPAGGLVITVGAQQSVVCNGTNGLNGSPGAPGAPGTVVSVVQLCPGVPSYPGVFVEVGVCISNQLYGVYSIPNAFFTLLPPGNYTSSGIGSACNLTVKAGCIVTH